MKRHLDTLRNVALFSACNKKELEKVAKASDEIKMTAGSLIVDQGQTGREAFIVLDGEVDIRRNNRKVATLGPGAVVGELSLLDHGPRTATAVCATDCTLLVIDQRRFLGVIDDVGRVYIKGRKKNMILGPSGENIYPEAIESIINSFEYVEDSVVFQQEGEVLARIHVNYEAFKENVQRVASDAAEAAAGVPKSIGDFLAEVRKNVNSRLSGFSRIGKVIEQEEPFEKTPTNKIKRFLYDKLSRSPDEGSESDDRKNGDAGSS